MGQQTCTYLFPHQGLLNGRQIFQRGEEHMSVVWTPNVFCEIPQLLTERSQNFILILDRICKR